MSRYRLLRDKDGLGLVDTFSEQRPLRVDFCDPAFVMRLGQAGRKKELVARAVKTSKGLRVLDCTAGLGRDAFVLAHLGCEVTLVERSPVIGELLIDGLARAGMDDTLAQTVSRMHLQVADALHVLRADPGSLDVIFIDPMFPGKSGSAAVSGEMQMLQRFIGTDEDAATLLEAALSLKDVRVVLKRPARGSWESPVKPVHVFESRNACYEVFGV